MEKVSFQSTDEYIATFPIEIQEKLQNLRRIIKQAAPEAEEIISYNMPAYRQNGMLVYFAAAKKHIGFYPTGTPIPVFKDELVNYQTSKGAIQLPLDKEFDAELITKIVHFKIKENYMKLVDKKKTKKNG